MQTDGMTLERKLVTLMLTAGGEDCGGPQKDCDAVAQLKRISAEGEQHRSRVKGRCNIKSTSRGN